MQADMYQYSSKSTNLKHNEAIFIVIHDPASRVCERSLRGYLCCHVTSMEGRRGQHFSYSSICQFTQWCTLLESHNRTNHREKDQQRSIWSSASSPSRQILLVWCVWRWHRQASSPILNDTNRWQWLGKSPKKHPLWHRRVHQFSWQSPL